MALNSARREAPPAALEGIRVLDFSQMMLGPFATQMLADLGADVIKVERPGTGEWERGLRVAGELVDGESAAFLAMNRNKRSIALDLKNPSAREALLRLARTCDVVVENFRPGVMDRLGLGYEDFKAMRADIIYCSGSGWGQRSEAAKAKRPGQDLLIQAATGLALNTGVAGGPPIAAGTSMADATGALTLANGILAALLARARHGVGQRVEVDLFHSTIAILCQEMSAMTNQPMQVARSEAGIAQPWLSAPFGFYQARDGWLALAMGDIGLVAEVFGAPDIAQMDPWHDRDRIKRRLDELTPARDVEDWVDRLLAAGLWAAPVQTMQEARDAMSAEDSPMLVHLQTARGRAIELVGCPITLSETPWRQRLRPPAVGEHTGEVLSEVLNADELLGLQEVSVL
jgi:crotonobetainyl-CoA:carnitine CoA-transferase CaiB-like acyl-CoA transferase